MKINLDLSQIASSTITTVASLLTVCIVVSSIASCQKSENQGNTIEALNKGAIEALDNVEKTIQGLEEVD